MNSYNMMLFSLFFSKLYFPSCWMVIYGSFWEAAEGEKGGGGGVGGSRCTVKGALFGIYTDMWDLGGGGWQGGWWWEMHGVGGWRRRWGLGGGGDVFWRQFYFLAFRAATAASTSSSGCSGCHWAMGRRGLASMSDQCFSPAPVDLLPTRIFPMASFLPILS